MDENTTEVIAEPLKKKISWKFNDEDMIATATYPTDETVSFVITDLPDDMLNMATYYGVKQKLSDSIARSKEEKLTPSEAIDCMNSLFEQMKNGDWNAKKAVRKSPIEVLKTKLNKAVSDGTMTEVEAEQTLALMTKAFA